MKDAEDFFSHWFVHICLWIPNEAASERYMWILMHGMLVHALCRNSST